MVSLVGALSIPLATTFYEPTKQGYLHLDNYPPNQSVRSLDVVIVLSIVYFKVQNGDR